MRPKPSLSLAGRLGLAGSPLCPAQNRRKIRKNGRTHQNLGSTCSGCQAETDRTVLDGLGSNGPPKIGLIDGADANEDGISVPEISDNLVERFLEAVRKFPCIYDTRKLEYRDVLRKENAWEAIRAECGLPTATDCQKLWKRLRDRYTREQKAIELTQRSGSGFVARKTWEFAQAMEFYKQCGRPRK
ncbi:hypothetical protein HPB49_025890 [Dermacentor silvarum]|nr:hypothetical protein HPB49_025890 [Dermacentor silvarum]